MSGIRTAGRALRLLPRNALVLLLRVYRAVVSPLYGPVCRYYPSCSAYALEAVQQHGAVVGSGLSAWRLLRCNPWSRGGIDDVPEPRGGRVPTTGFGFVLPGACVEHGAVEHDHASHDEERRAAAHA